MIDLETFDAPETLDTQEAAEALGLPVSAIETDSE